jgi:uncharacterized protein
MIAATEFLRRTGRRKAANGAFPAGFAGLMGTLASGNLLIGLAAAIAVFLFVFYRRGGNGKGSNGRRGGYIGSGGYASGGIGGGGFSGGGGSFGGGGASGSW